MRTYMDDENISRLKKSMIVTVTLISSILVIVTCVVMLIIAKNTNNLPIITFPGSTVHSIGNTTHIKHGLFITEKIVTNKQIIFYISGFDIFWMINIVLTIVGFANIIFNLIHNTYIYLGSVKRIIGKTVLDIVYLLNVLIIIGCLYGVKLPLWYWRYGNLISIAIIVIPVILCIIKIRKYHKLFLSKTI